MKRRELTGSRTWRKWAPAVVAPAVIAAVALAGSAQAGAAPDLPAKTAEQVLAMVGNSSVRALSGTLEQTSSLGLPILPAGTSSGATGAASALELLTGSHTARVYLDGPANVRVQVLDSLAERDLVRRGAEVWSYSSQQNLATHVTLPDSTPRAPGAARPGKAEPPGAQSLLPGEVPTPEQVADRLIAAIDPSTIVSVRPTTVVAGRPAYRLELAPRADDTLIGAVSIAVDAETGLPLRVRVLARGQEAPAFEVGFTSLSLATPAAERFEFVPPAGATVTEHALPAAPERGARWAPTHRPDGADRTAAGDGATAGPTGSGPTATGEGWSAVLELPAGAVPALADTPLLTELTRPVPGGRLLHTALVNVLLTTDGRVFAGSVPLERLQAAAAGA